MAVAQQTLEQLRTAGLAEVDPEIADAARPRARAPARPDRADRVRELHLAERARGGRLACRRTSTPRAIPGRRYYGGCEVVDEIEQLAIDRAKELFGAEHANVQPHAGAQANMAVYFALLQPGDTILSLRLDHGGHLTHGLKVNFSGRLYTIVHYGVSRETNIVDYDEVLALAKEHRPKLIVCGGSAYPRTVETDRVPRDRRRGRRAPDVRHGALRRARRGRAAPEPGRALRLRHLDDAQDARRPARRLRPLPRGARAGARPRRLPGHAGRAARARDRGEGDVLPDRGHRGVPRLPDAGARERRRARRRADRRAGSTSSPAAPTRTCSSSTCARPTGRARTPRSGSHEVKLTVNRNTVPFDERPPTVASGVRIGTPGGDDARLRRGRLPRGRPDHRRARSDDARPRRRSPRARGALRRSGRSTRASAATPTLRMTERVATGNGHARRRTRSSSTSSRTCATRRRRPSTSASSSTS